MILGIDEVGRGCWAGPLVVGAVVLGSAQIDGLTDSKALTKKKRETLDGQIREQTAGIGLGWVHAVELDRVGMAASLRLATRRAVEEVQKSKTQFDEIILDGTINFLSDTPLEKYVTTLKKADLLIESVSAASIVAKVARDQYMYAQAELYPEYKFESNVGYGAAFHREAIEKHGVTPLHRLSFKPLAKYAGADSDRAQEQPSDAATTRAIGDRGEAAVCSYLVQLGHEIVERNWRTKWCEIDIVSRKDQKLYFIEVKYRKNKHHGSGLDAITPKKLRQMKFASELFVQKHKLSHVDRQLVAASVSGYPAKVDTYLEIS